MSLPIQTKKKAVMDKLVQLGNPHIKEIRGKQYPIVDWIAMTDWVLEQIETKETS